MPILDFIRFAAFAVLGGLVGYSLGKSRGWVDAISECFDPFLEQGYYNGWVARHLGAPLEDRRVHPDELRRLVPTLVDPAQEICRWMMGPFNHLPLEEYRAQQVATLNGELDRERQSKRPKSDS